MRLSRLTGLRPVICRMVILGGMNSTPLIRLVPGGKVGDFYLPVFEGFTEDGKMEISRMSMVVVTLHIMRIVRS